MLRAAACRRFRAGFEPGQAGGHRWSCPACDAYAGAVEAAAAAIALPLPAGLERRLGALARPDAGKASSGGAPPEPEPVPQLPLPGALERHLQAIARRPAVPAWVRDPWPGLAASFALALLAQGLLGDPVARARPLATALTAQVSSALEEGAGRSESLEESWIEPTVSAARHRLDTARRSVTGWAESAGERARRLLAAETAESTE